MASDLTVWNLDHFEVCCRDVDEVVVVVVMKKERKKKNEKERYHTQSIIRCLLALGPTKIKASVENKMGKGYYVNA